jgi:membrane protease YdiL (CAAX protease family)
MIGVTMMIVKSPVLTNITKIISSWAPTIVFIIMFHKIYPNDNFFSFLKRQFQQRVHLSTIFTILGIYCIVLVGAICFTSHTTGVSVSSQLISSPSKLITLFFYQLIWGPMGEELGWRGYAINVLQKKHSPLKCAIIIAGVWGFWHMPLWFVSEYSGMKLVQYIIFFLICITAVSIIITAFYNLNHNLIIPILIHQFFNYINAVQTNEMLHNIKIYAVLYSIVAIVLIFINYKKCLYGKIIE